MMTRKKHSNLDESVERRSDQSRHPVVLAAEAVGSYKKLAELMGMSPQGITKMKQTRVIAERVLEMERLTGISRHIIRPDLYPVEECPKCGYLIGAPQQATRGNGGRNAARHDDRRSTTAR